MKMKKIWKRRWLQALRSRDYKQGEGALAKIDTDGKIKNCCLGVLCDVVKKHTGIGEWSQNYGDEFLVFKFKGQRDSSFLPSSVMDLVGLDSYDPVLSSARYGGSMTAMEANDTHKLKFWEIARFIERNL